MNILFLNTIRFLVRIYPFRKGKLFIRKLILERINELPPTASFSFKYGRFEEAPLLEWPNGYRELYLMSSMEDDQIWIWNRVVKSGTVVIDGGANYGYWSMVASKLVGRSGKVYSFEAVTKTYDKLVANIALSKIHNIIPFNIALSDNNKGIDININLNDKIGSQSSQGKHPDLEYEIIQNCCSIKLDEICKLNNISLIKLDIEGGELFALLGSKNCLDDYSPVITFEWNRETSNSLGYEPENILEYLISFNYKFYIVKDFRLIEFKPELMSIRDTPMIWAMTDVRHKSLNIK